MSTCLNYACLKRSVNSKLRVERKIAKAVQSRRREKRKKMYKFIAEFTVSSDFSQRWKFPSEKI